MFNGAGERNILFFISWVATLTTHLPGWQTQTAAWQQGVLRPSVRISREISPTSHTLRTGLKCYQTWDRRDSVWITGSISLLSLSQSNGKWCKTWTWLDMAQTLNTKTTIALYLLSIVGHAETLSLTALSSSPARASTYLGKRGKFWEKNVGPSYAGGCWWVLLIIFILWHSAQHCSKVWITLYIDFMLTVTPLSVLILITSNSVKANTGLCCL